MITLAKINPKDENGPVIFEKATAREFAKATIMHQLEVTGYWSERNGNDGMTEREENDINVQLGKLRDRIERLLYPRR